MTSLIITTFNEENNIENLLKDLKNQSILPDEIVIVDGGSTDDTVNKITDYSKDGLNINLIVDNTLNKKFHIGPIAAARNIGIQNAKHSDIIVTDAGCRLDKDFVKFMKEALLNNNIVAGYYTCKFNNDFEEELAKIFTPSKRAFYSPKFLPSSRSIAFKKECWASINGYPENSHTAEDTKFAFNLIEKFGPFYKEIRSIVYWLLPENENELKNKVINYGKGDRKQNLYKIKYFTKLFLVKTNFSYLYSFLKVRSSLIHRIYLYETTGYFENKK